MFTKSFLCSESALVGNETSGLCSVLPRGPCKLPDQLLASFIPCVILGVLRCDCFHSQTGIMKVSFFILNLMHLWLLPHSYVVICMHLYTVSKDSFVPRILAGSNRSRSSNSRWQRSASVLPHTAQGEMDEEENLCQD